MREEAGRGKGGEREVEIHVGDGERSHLGQMCLQSVLGVHVFSDAIGEGVVDAVPLVDHCLAAPVQQLFNATAHVLRRGAFRLRALHVVVAELGPSLRDGLTENICGLAGL